MSNYPDSKVHVAYMGPIWGRQDQGVPMLAPWTLLSVYIYTEQLHVATHPFNNFTVNVITYARSNLSWSLQEPPPHPTPTHTYVDL